MASEFEAAVLLRLDRIAVALEKGGSRPAAAPSGGQGRNAEGGGMVLPPYGRNKGQQIRGQSIADLEWYRGGCEKSLADPAKARWHDKERELLAVIEAEIARQRGGGTEPSAAGTEDDEPAPF